MRKIKVVVILVQQLKHGFTKNAKVAGMEVESGARCQTR